MAIISVSKAQTSPITDTTAYLKTIESKKSYFIGRPFSVLLDSLKIPIKVFIPKAYAFDVAKEKSTFFHFNSPNFLEDFAEKRLWIEWATPRDAKASDVIFSATDTAGAWTTAARDFYKTAVIKDIKAK